MGVFILALIFLVVGITAVTFNLIADLAYSALDPRVRVKA